MTREEVRSKIYEAYYLPISQHLLARKRDRVALDPIGEVLRDLDNRVRAIELVMGGIERRLRHHELLHLASLDEQDPNLYPPKEAP